jgi:hypothetical protein
MTNREARLAAAAECERPWLPADEERRRAERLRTLLTTRPVITLRLELVAG